ADERGAPKNRKKIEWKLLTDLPVQSRGDAIEKLEWYSLASNTNLRVPAAGPVDEQNGLVGVLIEIANNLSDYV
ncbi:hypothetical protein, partial [Bradyrhizobium sp. th.b2]|uniref:hypothetical protein n=1 Tax=Bradyrhizobium sp. th-b2 TaxID=172088 RepID=UPI001FD9532E